MVARITTCWSCVLCLISLVPDAGGGDPVERSGSRSRRSNATPEGPIVPTALRWTRLCLQIEAAPACGAGPTG